MTEGHRTEERELPTSPRHDGGDDLSREVNDRIMELGQRFGVDEQPLELICECEDSCCTHRIEISAAAFAHLRDIDGLHLVATDHVRAGRVVARGDSYLVVSDD